MKRVLVPLSGNESDEATAPLVGTLARQSGATVRLLRVFPVPEVTERDPPRPRQRAVARLADHFPNRTRGSQVAMGGKSKTAPSISTPKST